MPVANGNTPLYTNTYHHCLPYWCSGKHYRPLDSL
nr:unnamed protein product [Callosobruchus chinensis]